MEEKRQVRLILAVFVGVIVWLGAGVYPRHREISQLRREILAANALWEKEKALREEVTKLSDLSQKLDVLLRESNEKFIVTEAVGLLEKINNVANSANVRITKYVPITAASDGRHLTVGRSSAESPGFSLAWRGSFRETVLFLYRLEREHPSLRVQDLTFRLKHTGKEALEAEAICRDEENHKGRSNFAQESSEKR